MLMSEQTGEGKIKDSNIQEQFGEARLDLDDKLKNK